MTKIKLLTIITSFGGLLIIAGFCLVLFPLLQSYSLVDTCTADGACAGSGLTQTEKTRELDNIQILVNIGMLALPIGVIVLVIGLTMLIAYSPKNRKLQSKTQPKDT